MKRDLPIIVGLVAIIAAAFWGLTACGFINFDDPVYIIDNPHVTTGLTWTNFKWAWTSFYAGNYLPLTWLSLMLDAKLFGATNQSGDLREIAAGKLTVNTRNVSGWRDPSAWRDRSLNCKTGVRDCASLVQAFFNVTPRS